MKRMFDLKRDTGELGFLGNYPLFIMQYRLSDNEIPEEYFKYSIRGNDDNGEPATLEHHVAVNWCYDVLSPSELLPKTKKYKNLRSFSLNETITFVEFEEQYKKEDLSLILGYNLHDLSYCIANCKTKCIRKNIPTGIHAVTDFTTTCSKFKKA